MSFFKYLPWIVEPHPENFNGIEQLCLIRWHTCDGKTFSEEVHNSVAIINNIRIRGKLCTNKKKNNGGYVSFIDMDELSNKTALRIIGGYKGDMPVMIWCSIHGITIPPKAYHEVSVSSIKRTIGSLYYFNMDEQARRRKTIGSGHKPNLHNMRQATAYYETIHQWL